MRNLYNAFMKLFTEYGVLAWGRAPKTHLVKIERSVNKAVRIKLFQGKCTVTVKYQAIAVKVHEKVDPLSAPRFRTRVFTNHIRASINNTTNTKLILSSAGVLSLFYQSFKTWDNVPKNIPECHSPKAFPKEYQKYILQPVI